MYSFFSSLQKNKHKTELKAQFIQKMAFWWLRITKSHNFLFFFKRIHKNQSYIMKTTKENNYEF